MARLMFDGCGVTDGTDELSQVGVCVCVCVCQQRPWIYSGQLECKCVKKEEKKQTKK